MRPEDVYELTGVAEVRLDPSGRTAAFVVWRIDREANETRSAIWTCPVDGSGEPRPFTAGAKRDGSPRFSPDGSRLAFVSNRASEHAQLYAIPVAGGEAVRLTNLKEDVEQVAWSPDGNHLAFCARVPDAAYEEKDEAKRRPRRFTRLQYKLDSVGWTGDRRQHVYVVPADGSEAPRQLTDGDFEDGAPAWSPDGSRIVFASARHADWDVDLASDLYAVEIAGGEPERLTGTDAWCEAPVFSPDGSLVAFRRTPTPHDEPRHTQVAVLDLTTRDVRVLTESLDRQCGPYPEIREPIWDGGRVVLAAEDAGNVELYAVAAEGSSPPVPLLSGRHLEGYDLVAGTLVHVASEPTALPELSHGERRLTDVGRAFREGRELVTAERFRAGEVDAWLVRPAGFEEGRRYPVLLNVHGGPFAQYGNGFFDEFQVYAGAGYAVLYANPRGSSGYSEAWGRAIRGPANGAGPGWGSVDYDDVMAVVDEALARYDFLDPERLGVMGGSYGGFMTSWIVGHTGRFRAACSERAFNNYVSDVGSGDFGFAMAPTFGGPVWEHPDLALQRSPTSYADRIETPLLILHSENDLRCAVEQGEHLFALLRVRRREVELVRFPGESHELSRSGSPAHRVMRFETILEWFGRHL